MKWQWILWAVYLVAISFVPCSEGEEQCTAETSIVLQQPIPSGDDQCADDHCSPFCACFCCQVQCPAEIYEHPVTAVITHTGQPGIGYTESLHPVYCGNIWQPPRAIAA